MTREEAVDLAGGEDLLFLDPPEVYDKAIVGVARRCTMSAAVVYSRAKIIEAMVAEGVDPESASEHIEFNILGSWVGDATPLVLDTGE